MPVQPSIIACPAGQWTSIAQQMDARNALMVACPQCGSSKYKLNIPAMPSGVATAILPADSRRRFFAIGTNGAQPVIIGTDDADVSLGYGIPISVDPLGSSNGQFFASSDWGQWIQEAWFANTVGAGTVHLLVWADSPICPAIILAMNTSTVLRPGPFGTAPDGFWLANNLEAGPDIFRLSREADQELVSQQWYAWPVGTGTVNVAVYQSFDFPPATEDMATFTARLPPLDAAGQRHLETLRERIRQAERPASPMPILEQ